MRLFSLVKAFVDYVIAPCNPPYDCPYCMTCYSDPSELPETKEVEHE